MATPISIKPTRGLVNQAVEYRHNIGVQAGREGNAGREETNEDTRTGMKLPSNHLETDYGGGESGCKDRAGVWDCLGSALRLRYKISLIKDRLVH